MMMILVASQLSYMCDSIITLLSNLIAGQLCGVIVRVIHTSYFSRALSLCLPQFFTSSILAFNSTFTVISKHLSLLGIPTLIFS
jgi:hypothetical protein